MAKEAVWRLWSVRAGLWQPLWRRLGPGRLPEPGRLPGPGEDDRGFVERVAEAVSSWFGADEGRHRHHRGRGPKGYARSDDRIREDVSDLLGDDWLVDATEIEVAVVNSEVTLSGTVDGREQRRRAEDIAEVRCRAYTSRTISG